MSTQHLRVREDALSDLLEGILQFRSPPDQCFLCRGWFAFEAIPYFPLMRWHHLRITVGQMNWFHVRLSVKRNHHQSLTTSCFESNPGTYCVFLGRSHRENRTLSALTISHPRKVVARPGRRGKTLRINHCMYCSDRREEEFLKYIFPKHAR